MINAATAVRVGVIEVGSRAVRLLVADVTAAGELQVVSTAWDETGLASAVAAGGDTLAQALRTAARFVSAYYRQAEAQSAARIAAFGTEAMRRLDEASLERFRADAPIVRVMSAQQEAELSFIAGVMGSRDRKGPRLVIDQGSGSMEIIGGRLSPRLTIDHYQSVGLGTHGLVAALTEAGGAWSNVRRVVAAAADALEPIAYSAAAPPIVLGSAATKLAWLEARPDPYRSYDPRLVHGRVMRLAHIDALLALAESDDDAARRAVDPRRPDSSEFETVVSGLIALGTVLRRAGREEFAVCAHGTRYGYAWKLAAIERARGVAAPART